MSRNLNNITQNNGYNVMKPQIPEYWSDQFKASTHQTTGDVGKIIPIYWRECIPGEKINMNHDIAIQFTPFMTNVMHEFKGEIMDFFVPYRIAAFLRTTETIDGEEREEGDQLKWDAFITGGLSGNDTQRIPSFGAYQAKVNMATAGIPITQSLLDYFYNLQNVTGYPQSGRDLGISYLKCNVYNLIYNECLRNPDITPFKRMLLSSGMTAADQAEIFTTATGYWLNDRYTRARKTQIRGAMPEFPISSEEFTKYAEWEQRLETSVGGGAAIKTTGLDTSTITSEVPSILPFAEEPGGPKTKLSIGMMSTDQDNKLAGIPSTISAKVKIPSISATLNYTDFLYTLAQLKYMANNSRIKPRYTDFLRYRWGVIPEDSRMQEPEWINSFSFDIAIDTIESTSGGARPSGGTGSDYQGNITSQAWGFGNQNKNAIYECKEHGMWMSLLIVRPGNVYEGGLEKIDRPDRDRFDFPIPEYVNLPDEKILSSELYYTGSKDDDTLLGYESIYDYYRTETNRVSGYFRPSMSGGLGTYTLARSFENPVTLNDSFLLCKPEMQRIKQYPNQPDMLIFHRETIQEAINLPIINDPVAVKV